VESGSFVAVVAAREKPGYDLYGFFHHTIFVLEDCELLFCRLWLCYNSMSYLDMTWFTSNEVTYFPHMLHFFVFGCIKCSWAPFSVQHKLLMRHLHNLSSLLPFYCQTQKVNLFQSIL
jgi:hypothetical protein